MGAISVSVENLFLNMWDVGKYAPAAVISECHKVSLRIDGKDYTEAFKGTGNRLDVYRKHSARAPLKFCRVSGFDPSEPPKFDAGGRADWRWIVNIGQGLYGCPYMAEKSLLGPSMLFSEGVAYCKRFAPGPWNFVEEGNHAFISCYRNAIPDVICLDVELDGDDHAVLSLGSERVRLSGEDNHSIVLSNTCPDPPKNPNGDFGEYYALFPYIPEAERIVPVRPAGGVLTGGPACGGGGGCKTCPPYC